MIQFYVIYSFDIGPDISVSEAYPRNKIKRKMIITETNEQDSVDEDEFPKHRKLVGLLSQSDFEQFLDDTELKPEEVETMGSITLEFGWLPAISFNDYGCHYGIKSAYVTPMISASDKDRLMSEERWQQLRHAVINRYKER